MMNQIESQSRYGVYTGVMLMAVMASGCIWVKEVRLPNEPPPPAAPTAMMMDCPTGHCDPENPNGQGIYSEEQGNYCFLNHFNEERYCPEAFIQTPTGVMLEMRIRQTPFEVWKVPVTATYQATPEEASEDVELLHIGTSPLQRTRLQVRYRRGDVEQTAEGEELSRLTFRMVLTDAYKAATAQVSYSFKLQPAPSPTSEGGLNQYTLLYRLGGGPFYPWLRHCARTGEDSKTTAVSFLPGERVSGMSAYVTRDENVLTLACETGAIATCMNWGYTPWQGQSGQLDVKREYAFRSCLQAKRAAYFVGYGDLKSYTLNGTHIRLKDAYGIKDEPIPNLEALWSPEGATCLNREHRRRPELPINDVIKVPKCGPPPLQWSAEGKLATDLAP